MNQKVFITLFSSIFLFSACSSNPNRDSSMSMTNITLGTLIAASAVAVAKSYDDDERENDSGFDDEDEDAKKVGAVLGGLLLGYLAYKTFTGPTEPVKKGGYYKGSIEAAKAQIALNEKEIKRRIREEDGKTILNFNGYRIVDQKKFAFSQKDAQSVNALKSDDLLMFDLAFWEKLIQEGAVTPNHDKSYQKKMIIQEINKRHSNIDWELYRSIAVVGGLVIAGTIAVQSLKPNSSNKDSLTKSKNTNKNNYHSMRKVGDDIHFICNKGAKQKIYTRNGNWHTSIWSSRPQTFTLSDTGLSAIEYSAHEIATKQCNY